MIQALIVKIIHILIVLFVFFVPFTNYYTLLRIYRDIVLFLPFRWITDNSHCCLTVLENKLRGVKDDEGFIYSILNPFYKLNINENQFNIYVYLITICLWFYVVYKLDFNFDILNIFFNNNYDINYEKKNDD